MSSSASVRGSQATPSPARAIECSVAARCDVKTVSRAKGTIFRSPSGCNDPAQSRLRAIGEVFHRLAAIEPPARNTACRRRAQRHQRVGADHDAPELAGRDPAARVLVVVTKQKLRVAPQHHLFARLHAVGDQIEIAERQNAVVAANPLRKEREGQRVRRRDRQRPDAPAGDLEVSRRSWCRARVRTSA